MKKITLIVGAGVNKEIHEGIDLGGELLQNISDRVTDITSPNNQYLSKLLNTINICETIRNKFVKDINRYKINYESPSIDDFLYKIETLSEFSDRKDEYLKISKASIIFHVLGFEGTDTQKRIANDIKDGSSWLNVLSKYMSESVFSGKHTNLNIVTFNYDRILEYYLLTAFNANKNILDFINNHIYHVYGRIGCIEKVMPRKLRGMKERTIPFGLPNNKIHVIEKQIDHIKLIFEERNVGKSIKEVINESDELLIMGYGFDYINNIKIGLDLVKKSSNVRIAVYPNIDQTKEKRIRSFIDSGIIETYSCSDFLKKYM